MRHPQLWLSVFFTFFFLPTWKHSYHYQILRQNYSTLTFCTNSSFEIETFMVPPGTKICLDFVHCFFLFYFWRVPSHWARLYKLVWSSSPSHQYLSVWFYLHFWVFVMFQRFNFTYVLYISSHFADHRWQFLCCVINTVNYVCCISYYGQVSI